MMSFLFCTFKASNSSSNCRWFQSDHNLVDQEGKVTSFSSTMLEIKDTKSVMKIQKARMSTYL